MSISPSLAPFIVSASDPSPNPTKPLDPDPTHYAQTLHRINLINSWFPTGVAPGTRILELGCGQGDATVVLAHLVGSSGHVTALDPADLGYGAPCTLGECQASLSQGGYGERIEWVRSDPVEFLEKLSQREIAGREEAENDGGAGEGDGKERFAFDVAVLAHCIWYMASRATLASIFVALRGRVRRVVVAEWMPHVSVPAQLPHVFAAMAKAAFEAFRKESEENIQSAFAPKVICSIARDSGWKAGREERITPHERLEDGGWEVGMVKAGSFLEGLEREVGDGRAREVVIGLREAMLGALEDVGEEGVRSMDVWIGEFY